MEPFDLLGPLPAALSTTVLEASAGTGKTFALAGLVTRYVAEGLATLDEMLLITFSRAASQELRERVRGQILEALRAFDDPTLGDGNELVAHLVDVTPTERDARRERLRDALAGFDAATIATTHQFCHLVLKSLGVAGDTDAGVTLVETLDDLVAEIVDDLYLAHFGGGTTDPVLTRGEALTLASEVVKNPHAQLRPHRPQPESEPAIRVRFAEDVLRELNRRKRRLGILSYDDLLSRLAEALRDPGSPARTRMHQRWSIVMVDEFQDTDPVQWQVIDRAFSGRSTVILIGDPKQAIYGFRGGDIVTYLDAARTAQNRRTLSVNWRSDRALVDGLHAVLGGAELGDTDIKVRPVQAHHQQRRLAGAPQEAAFRLRVVPRTLFGTRPTRTIPIARLRPHICADLAADIGALLGSGATFEGSPLQARDIAVIVELHDDARRCHDALTEAGIPAVYTGDSDVYHSPAADDWLCLLEAFDQPHRSGLVRAAATTRFFGEKAESLARGGDALTDRIAETLREWADHARQRGVPAILEIAQLRGMGRRVLSREGGERHMTDLAHLTQLLHQTAHREHFNLPMLRDWLRAQREGRTGERSRRLDSDAAAVQIMTVFASKGLQFPIVYLPFAFNRHMHDQRFITFHDGATRCLHVGGEGSPDFNPVAVQGKHEQAGDHIRLTYVAMTRAQSQVVAWWAPSWDEPTGGLSRLLRGRAPGESVVPDRCTDVPADEAALAQLRAWESLGGPTIEESVVAAPPRRAGSAAPGALDVRHFHRTIDTAWRRTSYSGLIRDVAPAGVGSEPELAELDDEPPEAAGEPTSAATDVAVPSPMADLPTGAKFGTLVHAVLQTTDPFATDLAGELQNQIERHAVWWPVDVPGDRLASALVPLYDTPLGPLADGATLRQIGLRDRLCEMDFEMPLGGGDVRDRHPDLRLADVGRLLRDHLEDTDVLAGYADRLTSDPLGRRPLRGYLTGSVDVVLRVGGRYLVVDYKTNWLGVADAPLTADDYRRPRLVAAMMHSDYPLQALLYTVALHRFLRWRQPGYDPDTHLGGVLYLFLRGMCGPGTPTVDGRPAGVFGWHPPAALVSALSDLLHTGRPS
ncbi:exodeoxyribonuclease V subunit beta [Mycobacterium sp. Y57]|uniref:exodeoxyribonuclease V subunit beta n=1 Tax=Mycolicibacterium xanthum TaxID=2796469 RepID=UPI001C847DAC|nr:exodeoxyribonuclease V subunit beta [Mycolicibacterium xanthum]MBX7432244.1 exodeoxyribonuclease V subunit beta [Mycolicibacterium xanthum]